MDSLVLQMYAQLHNPWKARVHLGVAQNITVSTDTIVAFDTVDYDPGSGWTTGAAAKYTVQVAGYYLVVLQIVWTGAAAASVYLSRIFKNGASYAQNRVAQTGGNPAAGVTDLVQCNAGDTIQADVIYTASTGAALVGGSEFCYMSIQYQSPL